MEESIKKLYALIESADTMQECERLAKQIEALPLDESDKEELLNAAYEKYDLIWEYYDMEETRGYRAPWEQPGMKVSDFF